METPKEYYYTYYSYEEWGRGYFGSRRCECLPEEDIKYLGSFKDKTFNPTQKIILKDDYATREEAYMDEIILHDCYDVANNPHFANQAKATSTRFYVSKEVSIENGKKNGKKNKELGRGFFTLTPKQMRENGIKGGTKQKELGLGIHGLTPDQRTENSIKGGKIAGKISGIKTHELGLGIHGLTAEQRTENSIKGGKISGKNNKELGRGIFALTKEQRSENSKKTASQKWRCLETGYISNAPGLSVYQRARGIDTSQRVIVEC